MKAVILIALGLSASMAGYGPAGAQEGCRASQNSCSQINASCERNCQKGNNPSACVARLCSVPLSGCKANGVWKSVASQSCWKTSNRS
ncbi:hypothetical protein [Bosea sp. BH3]|uniref:hypothetical protein n=1 Tax=Bosea sp. BH3 TaxID=2871701 RepID=UPI0021CAF1DD|nr:hypothetical protein [Bosea sp. BH3]MCU4179424.1 hypothetical protein [Bosea sp. BH3]